MIAQIFVAFSEKLNFNAETFWYDIRILPKVYICDIKKIKNTHLFTLIGMSYESNKNARL